MVTVDPNLESIITVLLALIAAIIAWWQNYQKNQVIKFYTEPVMVSEAQTVSSTIVNQLPERSYKMSEATKRWLTFDATPENRVSILKQIEEAERQGLTKYRINFTGGYYDIEYGLQYGGSGNPGGKY